MNLVIDLLLAVYVAVSLLLVLVVLMQRPRSEGLGTAFASGMVEQYIGPATNVLVRFTTWMGSAFFILSVLLVILYSHRASAHSKIGERLRSLPVAKAPATPKTAAPPAAKPGALPVVPAPAVTALSPAPATAPVGSVPPVSAPTVPPAPGVALQSPAPTAPLLPAPAVQAPPVQTPVIPNPAATPTNVVPVVPPLVPSAPSASPAP